MYKTIRHGENSLQYTILPQNDDFRIEGKLSSAGSSCSSNSNGIKKSKVKRPKRRSFFAYLGLIFVCTVIVGAVLIPFLVSAECLPSPTEWFLKTKAAFIKNVNSSRSAYSAAKVKTVNISNLASDNNNNSNDLNLGKPVQIINKNGLRRIILKINKTRNYEENNVNNENSTWPVKTIDNVKNLNSVNILTENNENAEKLLAGSATVTINDSSNTKVINSETENEVKVIDRNLILNRNNENIETVAVNNNKRPAETQNYVTEIRFDTLPATGKQQAPIPPPTMIITTVRNQNINSENNNNNNNNNNNDPTSAQNAFKIRVRPTLSISASSINLPQRASFNANQINQMNQIQNSQNNTAHSIPTITTRIIQVPLLKSAAKKPIIPPVLVKNSQLIVNHNQATNVNNMPTAENSNLVDPPSNEHTQNSDWIHSHWAYIDPSTYFQWTGYKAEDSVLLPALLGFALIGMILIITVCLVARNKRTIVSSVRNRNRNDIEENGAEDNATLLTTTNLSDED